MKNAKDMAFPGRSVQPGFQRRCWAACVNGPETTPHPPKCATLKNILNFLTHLELKKIDMTSFWCSKRQQKTRSICQRYGLNTLWLAVIQDF